MKSFLLFVVVLAFIHVNTVSAQFFSDDLNLTMDSPGVIIIQTDGQTLKKISVEDPSRKLEKIHFSINKKIEINRENFEVHWNASDGVSSISVNLPQTVYAGKSITVEL